MSVTLISSLKTDTIDVIRNDVAGSYDDTTGLYVDGTTQTLSMIAVVSPATSQDLLHLPEAQRTSSMIKIYTEEPLLTANESSSKKSDIIVWRGVEYQIQKVGDWTFTDLPHYKSFASKIENDSGNRQL